MGRVEARTLHGFIVSASRRKNDAPLASVLPEDPRLAFTDELAALYADLWFAGKLDEIRQDDADGEEDE